MPASVPLFAIAALVSAAMLGSVMGIFSRELAVNMTVVEQVCLRSIFAALLVPAVCARWIHFDRIARAPRGELALVLARGVSMFVIAVSMGALAYINGHYGAVAIVMATPMAAVLSVVLLREPARARELLWVALAFTGAALTIYAGSGSGAAGEPRPYAQWALGAALLGSLFMAFGIVGQRKQTAYFNAFETAFVMLLVAAVVMTVVSGALIAWRGSWPAITGYDVWLSVLAAIANIAWLFAANYGLKRVRGLVANNVLALQPLFATLVGVLAYGELINAAQAVGGALIIAAIILIARERATAAPVPEPEPAADSARRV
jgi:drug/metabolite transporter (DMT)-like permease